MRTTKENQAYHREYRKKNAHKIRAWKKKVKVDVLTHYSDGELKCACCGEEEIGFLSLDHIDDNGAEHRKELGRGRRGGGYTFYASLRKNNYPKEYRLQVLCYNCNCAKQFLGKCPHEQSEGGLN